MKPRRPVSVKLPTPAEAEARVREMRTSLEEGDSYRRRSLRIHGHICARCAREFDQGNLHLLTVHHKDGNHDNNPPDGSNWENLCRDCHDDLHSRGLLGEYLSQSSRDTR
jgi:5-methylcytosine-specific restriction endonuclease McrA